MGIDWNNYLTIDFNLFSNEKVKTVLNFCSIFPVVFCRASPAHVTGRSEMSRSITKPTQWPLRPVKTRISLGIRPVWSESSLSAWRKLGSLATQWVHSEDSDQTGRIPRLIWVFAGHTGHFVGFVTRRTEIKCERNIYGGYSIWRLIYAKNPDMQTRYNSIVNMYLF